MRTFSLPRFVLCGGDALSLLADLASNLGWKRALVVTDATVSRLGLAGKVVQALEGRGVVVEIFDEVEPEPSFETAERAGAAACEFQPDVIVAVGGGSVIDAAKAAWVRYERPEYDLHSISPFEWIGVGRKCVFVAVPTTSGTGSDVTLGVVLSERVDGGKRKVALGSLEIVPYVSVLDPALPRGMPRKLTVATAVDALAHAVEALASTEASEFTDALALKSAEVIFRWLPEALRDPENLEARSKLHLAATMAGMAFSNSGLGLAHAIAHAVGPVAKLHHGTVVGIALPYVVEFNARSEPARAKYESTLEYLRLSCGVAEAALHGALAAFFEKVGQPLTVIEAGGDAEAVRSRLDEIVSDVFQDPDFVFNPVFAAEGEVRELVEKMLGG